MVCCDRPPTPLTQEQLFNQEGARPQEWQTFSVRFIPSWDCRYQNNHSLIVRPEPSNWDQQFNSSVYCMYSTFWLLLQQEESPSLLAISKTAGLKHLDPKALSIFYIQLLKNKNKWTKSRLTYYRRSSRPKDSGLLMGRCNISGNTLFTWEHWCVCCLYNATISRRLKTEANSYHCLSQSKNSSLFKRLCVAFAKQQHRI